MSNTFPPTISVVLEFYDIASYFRLTAQIYLDGFIEVYSGKALLMVDQI